MPTALAIVPPVMVIVPTLSVPPAVPVMVPAERLAVAAVSVLAFRLSVLPVPFMVRVSTVRLPAIRAGCRGVEPGRTALSLAVGAAKVSQLAPLPHSLSAPPPVQVTVGGAPKAASGTGGG